MMEVNEIGIAYAEVEKIIKANIGKSVHDIVVELKLAGIEPSINGDNIQAFISKAKSEVLAEVKAVEE